MKMNNIIANVSKTVGKVGFKAQQHSPEILLITGTIGVVTSTICACRATLKVSDVLEETSANIDAVHSALENPDIPEEKYSVEDSKKDLSVIYLQTGFRIVRLYAPAVIIGTASLGCIFKSHNILKGRNVALAAAYTTLDKGYKAYRERVKEHVGEAVENDIHRGVKAAEIEETTVNKKGEEKVTKKKIDLSNIDYASDYARYFDKETSSAYLGSEPHDIMFLRAQQNYANDLLYVRKGIKPVFLNEVYSALGIETTTAGQVVGWVFDENTPNGDNYIDFGIFDSEGNVKPTAWSYRTNSAGEMVKVLVLDFNPDGDVLTTSANKMQLI